MCDSLDELTIESAQVAAGLVPSHPFLLVDQMTTTDPSRSPAGTESMWACTHVPQRGANAARAALAADRRGMLSAGR